MMNIPRPSGCFSPFRLMFTVICLLFTFVLRSLIMVCGDDVAIARIMHLSAREEFGIFQREKGNKISFLILAFIIEK